LSEQPSIVCLGGATVDRTYQSRAPPLAGTSNPVSASGSAFGGVARNVAESLARLGVSAGLVSLVGEDEAGRALSADLRALRVTTRLVAVDGQRTAEYVAVLQPSGELAFGLADMAILDAFTPSLLDKVWPLLSAADWVFADCNLPGATLAHLIEQRRVIGGFRLAIDAVSTPKAKRLPDELAGVDLLFANLDEACAICRADPLTSAPDDLSPSILGRGAGAVVITLGERGAYAAQPGGRRTMLPAVVTPVVDVTGAGDALIAGTLSQLVDGAALVEALRTGLVAAALAIESRGSVRTDLSPGLITAARASMQGS